MPQLDKLSFFTQYFWLTLFFFSLYFFFNNYLLIIVFKSLKFRCILFRNLDWLSRFDFDSYEAGFKRPFFTVGSIYRVILLNFEIFISELKLLNFFYFNKKSILNINNVNFDEIDEI